jgi:glucose/arabinose dehydrogenase
MHRAGPLVVAGAAAVLLAACTSAGGSAPPTWVPSPAGVGPGEGRGLTPIVPVPSQQGSGHAPGGNGSQLPGGGSGGPSSTGKSDVDPLVVATHLKSPVGLTMLPDGTALVGERTTGRIVRVQPVAGQPVPTVRTLSGLDTAGDGGLLDLALSPSYDEDNLIYAYITTKTDNRVVDFTLKGPVAPVLVGIPKGRTGNTGRIAFGADGDLYVGTGDAGHPALAENETSKAGKVLRVDDIGDAAAGNPYGDSPIWAAGLHQVAGLCQLPRTDVMLEVESGAAGNPDEVNLLTAGDDYGYPNEPATAHHPLATLPAGYGSPGGCTVLDGRIWVTSLDGQALLSAPLAGRGAGIGIGRFTTVLHKAYGRLKTVVAAPDGALWLTTSNRDGHGSPVPADERVIRYIAASSGGNAPV